MVNYQLSTIYKIEPKNADKNDKVYVGSTSQKYLSTRFAIHKNDFRLWLSGNKKQRCSVSDIFLEEAPENCHIVLLEQFPCDNKDQMYARERYWIEKLNCVNKNIPGGNHHYIEQKDNVKK
jgi:hypothetical protein